MNQCNENNGTCPYLELTLALHDSVQKLTDNLISSTHEIATLSASLRDLSDSVKSIHRTVFGNGDVENSLITQITNVRSEQAGLTEKFNWLLAGASAIVGSVLGVLVYRIFQ